MNTKLNQLIGLVTTTVVVMVCCASSRGRYLITEVLLNIPLVLK